MAGLKLLVTGRPRAGKTTLVERVIERLGGRLRLAGFTTGEILDARGERCGFLVRTMDGAEAELARLRQGGQARAGASGPVRVGRYGVDLEAFERLALPELARRDADLLVIDEIGKMECASGRFRRALEDALDAPLTVLATLGIGQFPFFQALRERPDVELLTLTPRNREALVEKVWGRLREHGSLP
ncbi:MAG: nucleoside-triphosphatase [Terriglobia bacterium]